MKGIMSLKGILQRRNSTLHLLDAAKTILFYYVLFTYTLKLQRHIKARGVTTSLKEVHNWISRVRQGLAAVIHDLESQADCKFS